MKLVVGGTYRTRDGSKAIVIYRKAREVHYPFVLLMVDKDDDECIEFATEDGRHQMSGPSRFDLIAEWTEREFDE